MTKVLLASQRTYVFVRKKICDLEKDLLTIKQDILTMQDFNPTLEK